MDWQVIWWESAINTEQKLHFLTTKSRSKGFRSDSKRWPDPEYCRCPVWQHLQLHPEYVGKGQDYGIKNIWVSVCSHGCIHQLYLCICYPDTLEALKHWFMTPFQDWYMQTDSLFWVLNRDIVFDMRNLLWQGPGFYCPDIGQSGNAPTELC